MNMRWMVITSQLQVELRYLKSRQSSPILCHYDNLYKSEYQILSIQSKVVKIRTEHYFITVEHNWVCEKAWIPALSQSLFFCGAIPGMIFFGWFMDRYGRIPAMLLSNLVCLVAGVVTPFISGHISFFVLRFIMGLAFNTFFKAPHILGDLKNLLILMI